MLGGNWSNVAVILVCFVFVKKMLKENYKRCVL